MGRGTQALKGSHKPGRGQRHLNRRPVLEHVTQASRMSGPPKQIFVVTGSGKGMCSYSPLGSKTVIPPFHKVPTQILPLSSTARLSSHWKPGKVQTTRPGAIDAAGAMTPGCGNSNSNNRPFEQSAM
jgi:hypothetical protein